MTGTFFLSILVGIFNSIYRDNDDDSNIDNNNNNNKHIHNNNIIIVSIRNNYINIAQCILHSVKNAFLLCVCRYYKKIDWLFQIFSAKYGSAF